MTSGWPTSSTSYLWKSTMMTHSCFPSTGLSLNNPVGKQGILMLACGAKGTLPSCGHDVFHSFQVQERHRDIGTRVHFRVHQLLKCAFYP